jgi:hypothetical protein
MKTENLILLGAIALGGYLLWKSGIFGEPFGSGGGGPGGGNGNGNGNGDKGKRYEIITPRWGSGFIEKGTVIEQLYSPTIRYNDPGNTVIVGPKVKTGDIRVVPAYRVYQPGSGTGPTIMQPQPPLKIVNVFGFPVVPKLIKK